MKPNSFYHVRSKSRNKAGLSDASNIIYLHTTGLNAFPRLGLASSGVRSSERTITLMIQLLVYAVISNKMIQLYYR